MVRLIKEFFPLHGFSAAVTVILSQILASYIVNSLSYSTLYRLYPHFRTLKWERNGMIYQDVFRIRLWKEYVPAMGTFDKKHLASALKADYLTTYLLENLRAELCHEVSILFGFVICFFANGNHVDAKIMLWLIFINVPCIMIQRYNRPRFETVINRPRPDGTSGMVRFWENGSIIKEESESKGKV